MPQLIPLEDLLEEDSAVREKRHRTMIRSIDQTIFQSEWFLSRPQRVQDLFRTYPPWGFYVIKDTHIPVRHYGVIEYADGTLGFHAHVAHPHWTEKVVGGIPEISLERVPWWTPEQLELLQKNDFPRAFLEPFGFMVFQPST